MADREREPHGMASSRSSQDIYENILKMDREKKRETFRKYYTILAAVTEVYDDHPYVLLIFFVNYLLEMGKEVTSNNLISCLDQLDSSSTLFSQLYDTDDESDIRALAGSQKQPDDTRNSLGAADSRNSQGAADTRNSLGAADSRNSLGAADSRNSLGTANSRNSLGAADQPVVPSSDQVSVSPSTTHSNTAHNGPSDVSSVHTAPICDVVDKPNNVQGANHGQGANSPRNVQQLPSYDEVDGELLARSRASVPHNVISGPAKSAQLTSSRTEETPCAEAASANTEDPALIKERLLAVKNENKILEDYKRCLQCHRNPRGVTFLPCGHFTTCRECSGPMYVCTLCNRNILATVDTYLS